MIARQAAGSFEPFPVPPSFVRQWFETTRRRLLEDLPANGAVEGLAGFLGDGFHEEYMLPAELPEFVTVGNRCYIRPFLDLLAACGPFHILTLSKKDVRLFEATRFHIRRLDLGDVAAEFRAAMAPERLEMHMQFHVAAAGHGNGVIMHHGGEEDSKSRLLRCFHLINRAVDEVPCRRETPLLLAGVDYLCSLYRRVNTHPNLLPETLRGNADFAEPARLQELAWPILERHFAAERQAAMRGFHELGGSERVTVNPRKILPAAHQGRVQTLFVAKDVQLYGTFDEETGAVALHGGREELLNRAACDTIVHGGAVYPAPSGEMPGSADAAAVFRF